MRCSERVIGLLGGFMGMAATADLVNIEWGVILNGVKRCVL